MLNRNEQGHKESENFNSLHFKTVYYRVYKCTVILHVPMGRAHRESSMSKLDYDAKRVAVIYMELLLCSSPYNCGLIQNTNPTATGAAKLLQCYLYRPSLYSCVCQCLIWGWGRCDFGAYSILCLPLYINL